MAQSAAKLRMLAAIASLSRLEDVTRRMERAAGILETGKVLTPKALERGAMTLETGESRQELEGVFTGWLELAERRIARLEPAERRAIAMALVAAAEAHESLGSSMRQAELARERLQARDEPAQELGRKDHDLEL